LPGGQDFFAFDRCQRFFPNLPPEDIAFLIAANNPVLPIGFAVRHSVQDARKNGFALASLMAPQAEGPWGRRALV